MSKHTLDDSTLVYRCAGDPHVEILGGEIWIMCGEQNLRLPIARNAPEIAFMLCEAHDELAGATPPPWADRVEAWRKGGR